jgi:hypothetical protein
MFTKTNAHISADVGNFTTHLINSPVTCLFTPFILKSAKGSEDRIAYSDLLWGNRGVQAVLDFGVETEWNIESDQQ